MTDTATPETHPANLADHAFLDHCLYVIDVGLPFSSAEAARLFALAGEPEVATILREAAGALPFFLQATGPTLIAEACERLGLPYPDPINRN